MDKNKKAKIKKLVEEMLNESHKAMLKKLETVLNSGAIDVDGWVENISPMIIPKCIVTALLQSESTQYEGRGTSFEKTLKQEVKNIRYFM